MTATLSKPKAVQTVLWQVLFLNLLVAGLKIVVGLLSGILSMVADGFHSLMDSSSNIIGLVAMRVAHTPPDEEHPYGHRKAETLATLFIGILLIFAAYEIVKSAAGRLLGGAAPEVTPLSFGVMLFTITINLLVTLYEQRRGKALQSEILLADAQHTRSDIWVSLSVIAGLVGVRLGWPWLDAGVGLGIAAIIGYSAVKILSQAANILMDQAILPKDEIERLIVSMPEVEGVERIRSRGQMDETYVDLHVRIKPDTPTDYAHSIAHAVQYKIKEAFPQTTDVTVHIEPVWYEHLEHEDMSRQLKGIAHSLGGSAHEIWMHTINGKYFVELHLEVSPDLTLAEAHDLATQLENRGKQALSKVSVITTHIEPMGKTVELNSFPSEKTTDQVLARAKEIADEFCGVGSCHNLRLWSDAGRLNLSMHCTLPSAMSIVKAHLISQQVEEALRQRILKLKRVVVHVEPPMPD
jgi:cation diffusion facilitator family transporter